MVHLLALSFKLWDSYSTWGSLSPRDTSSSLTAGPRVWLSEAHLHGRAELDSTERLRPPTAFYACASAVSKHAFKTPTHTGSSCRKNLSEISLRFYPSVISSSGKDCNKPCPWNERKHNRAAHKAHTTEAPRERLQPNSTPVPVNAPTTVNDTGGPRWRTTVILTTAQEEVWSLQHMEKSRTNRRCYRGKCCNDHVGVTVPGPVSLFA